ncbi:MAG: acetylornithine deacetylase [Arenicellales bacterium]|jgi:acetylornithine deacetylase
MPLPDTLAMMRQLVGIPSVSSVSPDIDMGNLKVVELLAEWLQELNFTVEIIPLKNHPEKANLVATLGRGQGGLVLAGHTDTVPYDENLWNYNPLALTEAGNRLYGMGSSDMKGFFALAITAARIFSIDDLKEPLVIVATADEESTMHGARELAASGRLQARRVLIGEPTGLRPVHMHKGMMMESVHLHGCSGHSSDPALGNNAMEGMHSVIAEILRWRTELQQRFQNPDFKVPFPTLNLGRIAGGDNPNRICGDCELHFDLRPLPGMVAEDLLEELTPRLQSAIRQSGLQLALRPLMESVPPFASDNGSAIVAAAEKLTGSSAESAAYSTEAPFFQNIGLDAVVLGPGDIAQAHQPDEFLALDRLQPMIDVLTGMIRRFCVA